MYSWKLSPKNSRQIWMIIRKYYTHTHTQHTHMEITFNRQHPSSQQTQFWDNLQVHCTPRRSALGCPFSPKIPESWLDRACSWLESSDRICASSLLLDSSLCPWAWTDWVYWKTPLVHWCSCFCPWPSDRTWPWWRYRWRGGKRLFHYSSSNRPPRCVASLLLGTLSWGRLVAIGGWTWEWGLGLCSPGRCRRRELEAESTNQEAPEWVGGGGGVKNIVINIHSVGRQY